MYGYIFENKDNRWMHGWIKWWWVSWMDSSNYAWTDRQTEEWKNEGIEDRLFIRRGWRLFSLFILIDWAQYIFTSITVSSSYITSDWTFSTAFTRLVRSPYIDQDSESLPIYVCWCVCVCECVCAGGWRAEERKRKREQKESNENERTQYDRS